jgi:O-acetylhomoserine/O-acetylserine sulfhydrylase-like pyridoxal-dependent enzyme
MSAAFGCRRCLAGAGLDFVTVNKRYVRLSIGIEHIDDILADLDQAPAKV